MGGKLDGGAARTTVPEARAAALVTRILTARGMPGDIAGLVADHLVEADLRGVTSHGVLRVVQYARQLENGYLTPDARPRLTRNDKGALEVDGGGGIGIPGMIMAAGAAVEAARSDGISAVALRHLGHTGRIGAFAETMADAGCLSIILGGGGRSTWRQVAPYGGRKAILPTNPYAMAMPGGTEGPVVLDFATGTIAGGWIMEARESGALLPAGAIMDAEGHPSRDPEAYFAGGAILPAGGPKGSALAVMAELIAEAMLGPATTECNWLMIAIDTARYRSASALTETAEELLAELRSCPPAAGFDRVEVPGERERDQAARRRGTGIPVSVPVWSKITDLAGEPHP
jgi:uncharacterized oxidoreductase